MNLSDRQLKPFEKKQANYIQHMPANWLDELKNYIIYGLDPGSFHKNLYCDNLAGAAQTSDSFNEWNWIQLFMDFLLTHAPRECWGNNEKVANWMKLDQAVRFKICHKYGLILSPEEATWDILESSA